MMPIKMFLTVAVPPESVCLLVHLAAEAQFVGCLNSLMSLMFIILPMYLIETCDVA